MDYIRELLALLIVSESNMRCLHWLVAGKEFDNTHAGFTTSYYEMISEDVDYIAEVCIRLGIDVLNYDSAYQIAKEKSFPLIDDKHNYSRKDASEICDSILGNIQKYLLVVLDSEVIKEPMNVGIKSTLEGMYEKYDKEKRFLNKRRLVD